MLPPEPPWELVLRLRAAEPAPPVSARRIPWLAGVFGGHWRPWPVAYAGVLVAWGTIAILHLLTPPLLPASASGAVVAQTSQSPALKDAPMLDQTFLLTRNNALDPAWQ